MKKIFLPLLTMLVPTFIFAQNKQHLIVGTYTGGTKSQGIYVCDFDFKTGKAGVVSSIFTDEPSYLAVAPGSKFVYAVNEEGAGKGSGKVSSFSYENGKLTRINTEATGGDHPCYVSIDKTGKWLVAGNYSGGSFSIFPIKTDGSIDSAISTTNHQGNSIDKDRQEKPHVHCTVFSPDNKYLLVADLGTDRVMSYKFNEKNGTLGKATFISVQPGAGPRHLAFHPGNKYVYLVEEMFGNVDVFRYKKGKLKLLQTISMIPPKSLAKIGAADIHFSADGRFLYTSNRGDFDMITIYAVKSDGKLEVKGYQAVKGVGPRNFVIDPSGNFLLVANQKSDEVVIFRRDKISGLLTDTNERIKISAPVCLKWIN